MLLLIDNTLKVCSCELHIPLQPCNHCDSDDEEHGEEDPDLGKILFDPMDEESDDEEEDSWFDTMIERKLSEVSDVTPTELDPDSQTLAFDSQKIPMIDLEVPDSQPDLSPVKMGSHTNLRPVARPLKVSEEPMLPESPGKKNAWLEDCEDIKQHARESAARTRRIEALKAKIAELELEEIGLSRPRFCSRVDVCVCDSCRVLDEKTCTFESITNS